MQFSSADITALLTATGQEVIFLLNGVAIKTVVGKFRKDFTVLSPFETDMGMLEPGLLISTLDVVDITQSHTVRIAGIEYKQSGRPEDKNNGLTHISLVKK